MGESDSCMMNTHKGRSSAIYLVISFHCATQLQGNSRSTGWFSVDPATAHAFMVYLMTNGASMDRLCLLFFSSRPTTNVLSGPSDSRPGGQCLHSIQPLVLLSMVSPCR